MLLGGILTRLLHIGVVGQKFKHMQKRALGAVALCAAVLGLASSVAQGKQDHSIRAAAIAKMQEKLGGLRGTIALDARFIFLTEKMLDHLKPARPSSLDTNEKPDDIN